MSSEQGSSNADRARFNSMKNYIIPILESIKIHNANIIQNSKQYSHSRVEVAEDALLIFPNYESYVSDNGSTEVDERTTRRNQFRKPHLIVEFPLVDRRKLKLLKILLSDNPTFESYETLEDSDPPVTQKFEWMSLATDLLFDIYNPP